MRLTSVRFSCLVVALRILSFACLSRSEHRLAPGRKDLLSGQRQHWWWLGTMHPLLYLTLSCPVDSPHSLDTIHPLGVARTRTRTHTQSQKHILSHHQHTHSHTNTHTRRILAPDSAKHGTLRSRSNAFHEKKFKKPFWVSPINIRKSQLKWLLCFQV